MGSPYKAGAMAATKLIHLENRGLEHLANPGPCWCWFEAGSHTCGKAPAGEPTNTRQFMKQLDDATLVFSHKPCVGSQLWLHGSA